MERAVSRKERHPAVSVHREPMEHVIESARVIFPALGHCAFHGGERTGIVMERKRSLTLFSRWHIRLPSQRVFVSREMMEE